MTAQTEAPMPSGNRLLDKLPEKDLKFLRPHLEHVELKLTQTLISPYEPINHIYFPISALASLVTVLEDGATVESGAVGCEGMVGVPVLLNAGTTPMLTLVQIAGQGWRIKAEVVKELFDQGGAFFTLLNRYIHALLVVTSQSAACNRRHDIEARLARWLLMSCDGVNSHELGITQEFLAVMLGVRRPGVTEAAIKFQSAGLISYSRGHVRILDRPALERAACECYRIVKDEYERLLS